MTEPASPTATTRIIRVERPPTGGTLISWETNAAAAEVHVTEDGAPEKLLATKTKGSLSVDWVLPGHSYIFRLYDSNSPGQALREASFVSPIAGKLSLIPGPESYAAAETAKLEWEVTDSAVAEIFVSESGGDERLVCRGPSGDSEISGLKAGTPYVFRLYAVTKSHQLLEEKRFLRKILGRISANPNPINLDAGSKTTLTWETSSPDSAEICVSEDDGATENLVCRGRGGSFEVAGLRLGAEYLFRLYATADTRSLLAEVRVKMSDIPWAALLERLQGACEGKGYSQELGEFLGSLLARAVHRAEYPQWFRSWEEKGVHVTPVHFYEAIPDSRSLQEKLWDGPKSLAGFDLNEAGQHRLLCEAFPTFKEEYLLIPLDPPAKGTSFYLRNGRFEGLDPMLAYCMVRHFHPRQIIEVGSGFSTLILAQAATVNGDTELHSVEPYPADFLVEGVPGLTSLLVEKVEEVDLAFFDRLEAGDCLFIDTSHVVRIGGDVNYLFLEVLPRLKPGVIVHVHDIFLPFEYPKDWVLGRRRFWTEQYLLQAFLVHNSEFEVLVSSGFLKAKYPEELKSIFPTGAPWQGGSFWMRRKVGV